MHMKGKKSRQEDLTATNPHNCISLPFDLKYPTISTLAGISPIHSNTFHVFCKKCSCVPKNQTKIVELTTCINSRWGKIFRTYPDRLRGPPSLLCNGYRVFPGGKGGRGVMLTTHPLLVSRLRKSWATPPLTLWVLLGLLLGSLYPLHV
jgi:hypothetical protein